MEKYGIDYFLGANTPVGFVSLFDGLYCAHKGWRCCLIKGGPGSGKSTLMKYAASEIEKRGYEVERVHCSSDPESLDAIRCEKLKIAVADATAPHVIEPLYPGAVEFIIDPGTAWDKKLLRENADDIIALTKECGEHHARAVRFLKAAGVLISDSRRMQAQITNEEKIALYCKRFIKRNTHISPKEGSERKIMLSALTPNGAVFFKNTVKHYAETVIEIDDSVGYTVKKTVDRLRLEAIKSGLDIITAYCPIDPHGAPEHIIIPSLSIAFVRRHRLYGDTDFDRTVHATRFVDKVGMQKRKARIAFNTRAADEMLFEAVSALKDAKRVHDELEKIYIRAMDFEKLDTLRVGMLQDLLCR